VPGRDDEPGRGNLARPAGCRRAERHDRTMWARSCAPVGDRCARILLDCSTVEMPRVSGGPG
jgi:hypothetical protein